jgi:hypothetical protein
MKMVSPKSLSDAYCDMEYCRDTADGVIVNVKAQPRSSRSGIDGVLGMRLKSGLNQLRSTARRIKS